MEVDDEIAVTRSDIKQAYAGSPVELAACSDCRGEVSVHLVEREPKPTDPHEHVVARVIAPRQQSDEADYDHAAWTLDALTKLLGK